MRWMTLTAALAVALGGSAGAEQQQTAVAPTAFKEALGPAEFQKFHGMIRPDPKKSFEAIPWLTSLWEARKKAAAGDKPIILWSGDPHPLGVT